MNEQYTRRQFLQRLALTSTTVSLLPLLDDSAHAAPAQAASVGKVSNFKPGEWKPVKLPTGTAAFVRRLTGKSPRFQALSALCSHKGCPVAWRPGEKHFVCPCHRGKFDANGKNVAGPPPAPLSSLPVNVVRGLVMVGG